MNRRRIVKLAALASLPTAALGHANRARAGVVEQKLAALMPELEYWKFKINAAKGRGEEVDIWFAWCKSVDDRIEEILKLARQGARV